MRVVVVGASSGLGHCISLGLSARGADVAMLARRVDRLQSVASEEPGTRRIPIACDVTEESAVTEAIDSAAAALGGIDALIYSAGIGTLSRLRDTSRDAWLRTFDTNVVGAALSTSAALPHLESAQGSALYLSSVSASLTPPWPGLGAYAVSKAALDKLVEAWRAEHPSVGFTRVVVGDCGGGTGDSTTEFAAQWDERLAVEFAPTWFARGYMNGSLIEAEDLVTAIDGVLRSSRSAVIPSVSITPRQLL